MSTPHTYLGDLFGLQGRIAVVTGGSSGIGRAMAEALARAGARVVIVARGQEKLFDAVRALESNGCEAAAVSADLGIRIDVRAAAEAVVEKFGEPDILVNCAGINVRPPLSDLGDGVWDATMALNVKAPFLLGQRFGPIMASGRRAR